MRYLIKYQLSFRNGTFSSEDIYNLLQKDLGIKKGVYEEILNPSLNTFHKLNDLTSSKIEQIFKDGYYLGIAENVREKAFLDGDRFYVNLYRNNRSPLLADELFWQFEEYLDPPEKIFQFLLANPNFLFGYAVDEEDDFRQNEKYPDHYVLRELEIRNVKWTKKNPYNGRRNIDIWKNPGRRAIIDGTEVAIGWKMWIGRSFQKFIPKELIKSFRGAVKIVEYDYGVIEVQLFNHPKDALRNKSFRKKQKKFREHIKLDQLIEEHGGEIHLQEPQHQYFKIKIKKILESPLLKKVQNLFKDKKKPLKPDLPKSFGYKSCWFAISTKGTKLVAEMLKLESLQKSSWEEGLEEVFSDFLFISPPIDGWTLVVGNALGSKDTETIKKLLEQLSKEFGEAQYFSTHRVSEYHGWMRAVQGEMIRAYEFSGDEGRNLIVEGKPSKIELNYDLCNTLSDEAKNDEDYLLRNDIDFPNEDMVMQIAADWSIDPTKIDQRTDLSPNLGIIGRLKN